MHNHNIMRSLSLLTIIGVVLVSTQSNIPRITAASLQPAIVQNFYLPTIMNRFPRHTLFGVTLYVIDDANGLMRFIDGGTRWTRTGFIWSSIEPVEGYRQWDVGLEQQLLNAAANHIQPIMLIEGTPNWALKPGYSCGAVAEDKFAALSQFAFDLVQRYSGSPYNIRYWELWNEPDAAGILGCWGDPNDTQYYGGYYYGQMLRVVSQKMKEADPRAQVLVGGLLLDCDPNNPPAGKDCTPSKFLKGVLESGAGPYFDGVSFHAYDYYTGTGAYGNANWQSTSNTTGPILIAKANYLRDLLGQYGFNQKYLVSTETAVFYGPNIPDPPCDPNAPLGVEVTKVYYVIQSYAVAVAKDLKASIWHAALGGRCAALLNADLTPKPAYYAYQFAQQKLGEAFFVRQISEYEGVMGYEYEIPGRRLWVVWSLDGLTHTLGLPGIPVEVNRVGDDGQAVLEPISVSLTIDFAPRFVEFTK